MDRIPIAKPYLTEEEAKAFIEEGLMKTEKRYRRDVY